MVSQQAKRIFYGILRDAHVKAKARDTFLGHMEQGFRRIPTSVIRLTAQNIADSRGIIDTVAQVFTDPTGEYRFVMQNLVRMAERQYSFSMDKDFKDLGVRHVNRQTRSKLSNDLRNLIKTHLHLPEPYGFINVKIEYKDDDRFIRSIRVKTFPLMTREEMRTIIRQYLSDNIDQVRDKSEQQLAALVKMFQGTTGGGAATRSTGRGGRKSKRGRSSGGASQDAKKSGAHPTIPVRYQHSRLVHYDDWQRHPQTNQDIDGYV